MFLERSFQSATEGAERARKRFLVPLGAPVVATLLAQFRVRLLAGQALAFLLELMGRKLVVFETGQVSEASATNWAKMAWHSFMFRLEVLQKQVSSHKVPVTFGTLEFSNSNVNILHVNP